MPLTLTDQALDLAKRLAQGLRGIAGDAEGGEVDRGEIWTLVKRVVDDTESQRDEIQKLRDFYDGEQIRGTGLNKGKYYIPDWPDENDADKKVRADRMEKLAWNRIRDGVNTHADALYAFASGEEVDRRLDWDEDTEVPEEDRKWLASYLKNRFWRTNDFPAFAWDVWRTVGAERSVLTMLMWMDGSRRRLRRFAEGSSRSAQKKSGVAWLEKLDNLQCIALPDVTQTRELGAVIRWYINPDRSPLASGVARPGQENTITELVTDNLWLRWGGTELVPHQWGFRNRYGDVRSVFVWGRNPADIADSEDALSAQVLLMEDLYNGQEIKRNHAFPETLYKGYDPPMREDSDGRKVLQRGPNVAHVAADPDADIIKRGPDAGVSDVGIAKGDIQQMLDDAMGLSFMERGSGSDFGQLRSAPALGRTQAKSERRRSRKLLAAKKWEQDVFQAVRDVTVYHAFGRDRVPDFMGSRLIVQFPEDAFTSDPYTKTQQHQIEVEAGLESRRNQIRKRHPELSEDEIDEMLEEIEEDREKANTPSPDPSAGKRANAQPAARQQEQ